MDPYVNPVSPSSPQFAIPSGTNKFAIPVDQKKQRRKKFLFFFILLPLLGFGAWKAFMAIQSRQPIADIRNFAQDQGINIPGSLTELTDIPADIAMNIAQGEAPFDSIGSNDSTVVPTEDPFAGVPLATYNEPNAPTVTPYRSSGTNTGGSSSNSQATDTPTPTQSSSFGQIVQTNPTHTQTPTPTLVPLSHGEAETPTPTNTQQQANQETQINTPTPTLVPLLSCQKVELYKGSQNVSDTPSVIKYGDTVRFLGYASYTGAEVKSLTFRLKVGDSVEEVKEVAAVRNGNNWVAQYEHTFTEYGKHRVTVVAVTAL